MFVIAVNTVDLIVWCPTITVCNILSRMSLLFCNSSFLIDGLMEGYIYGAEIFTTKKRKIRTVLKHFGLSFDFVSNQSNSINE